MSPSIIGCVMSDEWIDVSFRSDVDAAEVLSLLADPSAQGSWQDEGTIHLYWPSDRWQADRLVQVQAILRQLGVAGAAPDLLVRRLPHQDWNQQWAQSVKPLRVGRRMVIRPSWELPALNDDDVEIILDPKQAFGTGHHATTRLLLERLEESIHGGESVLDVGTGSGILAMAAVKLGAARAIGIDNDPVAIDCARDYARLNGCESSLTLSTQPLSDFTSQRFDVVLANLDRPTLLQLCAELAHHVRKGARLLVSGLLLDQQEEICDRLAAEGASLARRCEQDGWAALELLVTESCEGGGA